MRSAVTVRVSSLVLLCATFACEAEHDAPRKEPPVIARHADADEEGKLGRPDETSAAQVPVEPEVAESAGERAAQPAGDVRRQARVQNKKDVKHPLEALGVRGAEGSVSNVFGPGGLGARGAGAGGGGSALGIGGLGSGTGLGKSLGGLKGASYGMASRGRGRAANYSGVSGRVSTGAAALVPSPPPPSGGTFVHAGSNAFVAAAEDNQSTFAIDVDTGSYLFARAFLESGSRPPASSVRVEEWVNAHHYAYAAPGADEGAFRIHLAAGPSPFRGDKHLLRVALQGRRISAAQRKATHLTFLVDVSGSMTAPDKLPLVRDSLHLLVEQLRDDDSVALVTYAGATKLVLPTTSAANKRAIHAAIDQLTPGGGTAMGSGMEIAYRQAALQLSDEKMSRVLVLSDGDANIGRVSYSAILDAVRGWVSEGVTVSTVGFGRGNYNDHLMEGLADAGNGNYTYLDSKEAAHRFFERGLVAMLQVIAQDVKVQVEMNPAAVRGYRLIGYENRDVADKDFANDKVDGGEIGAGHAVTALYELDLAEGATGDVATVRVRAKEPRGLRSRESVARLSRADVRERFEDLDDDTRFASGVALAAELLRQSPHVSHLSLVDAANLVAEAVEGAQTSERTRFLSQLRAVIDAERALARR